jgi:hypothetical protein
MRFNFCSETHNHQLNIEKPHFHVCGPCNGDCLPKSIIKVAKSNYPDYCLKEDCQNKKPFICYGEDCYWLGGKINTKHWHLKK